jgi:hypothetical protein
MFFAGRYHFNQTPQSMRSELDMKDLEEAEKSFRLLADTVLKLRGTELAEDPEILKQLEQFATAMSAYHKQLSALSGLCSEPQPMPIIRPPLYLVKR